MLPMLYCLSSAVLIFRTNILVRFASNVSPDKLAGIINHSKSLQKYNRHDLLTGMEMQASIKLPHTIDRLMVESRGYYTSRREAFLLQKQPISTMD